MFWCRMDRYSIPEGVTEAMSPLPSGQCPSGMEGGKETWPLA